jgi:hypothetical protein
MIQRTCLGLLLAQGLYSFCRLLLLLGPIFFDWHFLLDFDGCFHLDWYYIGELVKGSLILEWLDFVEVQYLCRVQVFPGKMLPGIDFLGKWPPNWVALNAKKTLGCLSSKAATRDGWGGRLSGGDLVWRLDHSNFMLSFQIGFVVVLICCCFEKRGSSRISAKKVTAPLGSFKARISRGYGCLEYCIYVLHLIRQSFSRVESDLEGNSNYSTYGYQHWCRLLNQSELYGNSNYSTYRYQHWCRSRTSTYRHASV